MFSQKKKTSIHFFSHERFSCFYLFFHISCSPQCSPLLNTHSQSDEHGDSCGVELSWIGSVVVEKKGLKEGRCKHNDNTHSGCSPCYSPDLNTYFHSFKHGDSCEVKLLRICSVVAEKTRQKDRTGSPQCSPFFNTYFQSDEHGDSCGTNFLKICSVVAEIMRLKE